MVTIKKGFMLQCMLGTMDMVCIMVVPNIHCSMNRFYMKDFIENVIITKTNTAIKNQYMNLNNGDN